MFRSARRDSRFIARSRHEEIVMDDRETFEETYPKYEFSELVRLGLVFANWIIGRVRRAKAQAPDARAAPASRRILPAE
jgi:hypothetical protein